MSSKRSRPKPTKTASLASAVRPFQKRISPQQANPAGQRETRRPAKAKFYEAP